MKIAVVQSIEVRVSWNDRTQKKPVAGGWWLPL